MTLELGILVAVVIGLVEVAKRVGLKGNYLPLLAVLLGIIGSCLGALGYVGHMVITGIVAGLTAVGLFSGVKNILGK